LKRSNAARPSAPASREPADAVVRIGYVARPHGVRGALRVALDNPDSESLAPSKLVTLDNGSGRRAYTIAQIAPLGRGAVRIELEGIVTREAADALRGAIALIATADLPPESAGEFYTYRAIGCEVRTTDGSLIGRVTEIFPTGANDVLVVENQGSEVLVPVIADVIKHLDFDRRVITIEAVPGLLD
jgi:16S rRNA processing protein RimM